MLSYHFTRCSTQYLCHSFQPQLGWGVERSAEAPGGTPGELAGEDACATASGLMKNSNSICSNSRERKVKLRGLISLRNALPIWQTPNGTFWRETSRTFLNCAKMAWAVSGRR